MSFSDAERGALLSVKGVGPNVIKRFEEIGIDSFSTLAAREVDEIADMVADMLQTTCWKNSPQSKSAIAAAIARAQKGL